MSKHRTVTPEAGEHELNLGQHSAREWSTAPADRPDGRHHAPLGLMFGQRWLLDVLADNPRVVTPATIAVRVNDQRATSWLLEQTRRSVRALPALFTGCDDTQRIQVVAA